MSDLAWSVITLLAVVWGYVWGYRDAMRYCTKRLAVLNNFAKDHLGRAQ